MGAAQRMPDDSVHLGGASVEPARRCAVFYARRSRDREVQAAHPVWVAHRTMVRLAFHVLDEPGNSFGLRDPRGTTLHVHRLQGRHFHVRVHASGQWFTSAVLTLDELLQVLRDLPATLGPWLLEDARSPHRAPRMRRPG